MRLRAPVRSLSSHELLIAWQSASLLLSYPEEALLVRLPMIRSAIQQLPPRVGEPLRSVAAHLESTPLSEAQVDYFLDSVVDVMLSVR